ncbi:MAG TPA: hypothetical protein VFQ61_10610 [Polyangiaceae bacterium]|nr:hypothetical protein [Polyangiaceae bacterium]
MLQGKVQKPQQGRGEPRARAKLRAKRYATWKELQAATIEWCRLEAPRLNPRFNVADFERQARKWARFDDEPRRLWEALEAILERIEAFLVANPDSPSESIYAGMLDRFMTSKIEGNDGKLTYSIRERLRHGRDRYRGTPRTSLRVKIVSLFSVGPNPIWPDKKPRVRELAVLSLLAGCIPEGEKRRQEGAVGDADRPTIAEVLEAEQTNIRAVLKKLRKEKKEEPAASG